MLTVLDARLRMALQNESAALTALNDLHRQILGRPHPQLLSELLGKYAAIAAARAGGFSPAPASLNLISNLMNSFHQQAKAIVQNLRA